MGLYKTTIVIWSDTDPRCMELDELARDAVSGESYCAFSDMMYVEDPEQDDYAPDMEFFRLFDDESPWIEEEDEE